MSLIQKSSTPMSSIPKKTEIFSIWSYSRPDRRGVSLPKSDVPATQIPPAFEREDLADLPEISEMDLVRHYTRLSQLNFSIDTEFYPLGSCTMKYNPRINERVARFEGFTSSHPYQLDEEVQGNLRLMHELQEMLGEISGFKSLSLQPAAGAQGELSGVFMIKKYHKNRGDFERNIFLIPDSAHGTNPATVAMAGFKAVEVPSDKRGNIDLVQLKTLCREKYAGKISGIMVTNPNTLGLFEENISEVIEIVHESGGLVYGDGANLNAIMGIVRPGDLDFDVMHFNLHKTFSTPHGGGGPGAGPVGCNEKLKDFLPGSVIVKDEQTSDLYRRQLPSDSIGSMKSFYGNFGVLVRAYAYILAQGGDGLKEVSQTAVLNANYLRALLKDVLPSWFDRSCMHEFVASSKGLAEGVSTLDIAKRLIDYGFHPPTIYFPLNVPEALMIEPSESESIETVERFAQAMREIIEEAKLKPQLLQTAPHDHPICRMDEVKAVRVPILRERLEKREESSS